MKMVEGELTSLLEAVEEAKNPSAVESILQEHGYEIIGYDEAAESEELDPFELERGAGGTVAEYWFGEPEGGRIYELTAEYNTSSGVSISVRPLTGEELDDTYGPKAGPFF